jgi:hypothetical protein
MLRQAQHDTRGKHGVRTRRRAKRRRAFAATKQLRLRKRVAALQSRKRPRVTTPSVQRTCGNASHRAAIASGTKGCAKHEMAAFLPDHTALLASKRHKLISGLPLPLDFAKRSQYFEKFDVID